MSYLISYDFNRTIQDVNLQQIISGNAAILDGMILAGEAECKSYLVQRFDISNEFKNTNIFSKTATYYANDRVYLSAAAYVATNTYSVGQQATQAGIVYICTATTTGTFDPTKWTALGASGTIFYITYPAPPFDFNGLYSVGSHVYWKGKVYSCKIATPVLDHDTSIQYRAIENLPYLNVPPDDTQNGLQYWGTGAPYSVVGVLPTDGTKWTQGDNRDQQIVLYLIDIVLYHVHSRIAPRNIPDLRQSRYHNALQWLKMVATGDVTPALPLLQPKQGGRIRFGGGIRQINSY